MKKYALVVLVAMMASCMSVKQIGKVNMISNRNIESKADYVPIRNYMGGSKKELKRLKAASLEQAIDNVVRNTPGGEFLKNVKIYIINNKYFAVEGDIWGFEGNGNMKGFKVGDMVQWKDVGQTFTGTIVDLKNEKRATVKDSGGKLREVKYSEMLKVTE